MSQTHIKICRNIFSRNDILWVCKQEKHALTRKSTKLKRSALAISFVSRKLSEYFNADNDKIRELELEYKNLEDKETIKRIEREEIGNINVAIKQSSSPYYIKNIIDKVLNEKSFLKVNTIKGYMITFNCILQFLETQRVFYINEFKREHCVSFMHYLYENGVSTSSINVFFIKLKAICDYAVDSNLIDVSPYFKPKTRIEATKSFNPFTLDEVFTLLKNSKDDLNLFLSIGFFTGMRKGEILALTWNDIDFDRREIKVDKTINFTGEINTPKTLSSNRVIDLLDILYDKLIDIKGNPNDVIIKTNDSTLRREFNKLLKNCNMKRRRLYDTRHTFASIMLSKGEEAMWVGCKMLGHKDLNETYRSYAKYLPKEVKERAKFLRNYTI